MSLNINGEEAHRLARELADACGTSLTEAVTASLRRSVRGADEAYLLAEVAQIQNFLAEIPDRDTRPAEAILDEGRDRGPGNPRVVAPDACFAAAPMKSSGRPPETRRPLRSRLFGSR